MSIILSQSCYDDKEVSDAINGFFKRFHVVSACLKNWSIDLLLCYPLVYSEKCVK